MAGRMKIVLRAVLVTLVSVVGVVALATPATARVSIVPDAAQGGGTQTFAFRLANERPDTASTELELTFPDSLPIAYVQVAPVPGWTATIKPRPLNPPARVGDRTVTEVAGSIVLRGGSIPPHQFEQFLVTMGPLPADGRLVFEGTQRFANGSAEKLTGSIAPTISFGAATAEPKPASAGENPGNDGQSKPSESGYAPEPAQESDGPLSSALLWVAVGLGLLVIAVTGFRAYRRRGAIGEERTGDEATEEATEEATQKDTEKEPEEATP